MTIVLMLLLCLEVLLRYQCSTFPLVMILHFQACHLVIIDLRQQHFMNTSWDPAK